MLSLERVDSECLPLQEQNHAMELQRLSRRVSELVFDRQEFEYNCRQKDLRNAEQMQSVKTFDHSGYPGNSTETHKHSISRHGIQARLDNEFLSQLHRVKAAVEAEAANAELRAQLDALQRDLQSAVHLNDSHAAEIARVIQLRLEESRSAILESQEAATSFQQYSDMVETRFHALQQNLCDALQQSKKAAAEADMHNAELRAQLKAMQCAKAVPAPAPAPAPSAVDAAAEALVSKEAKRKEIEARVAAAREKLAAEKAAAERFNATDKKASLKK